MKNVTTPILNVRRPLQQSESQLARSDLQEDKQKHNTHSTMNNHLQPAFPAIPSMCKIPNAMKLAMTSQISFDIQKNDSLIGSSVFV